MQVHIGAWGAFNGCNNIESIEFGAGVTSIPNYLFGGSSTAEISEVIIPAGVTSIGDCAFQGCSGIASVTIPSSVTSIGGNAFNGCTSLATVNYAGTSTQWSNINIAGGNDPLTGATINVASN